MIRLLRQVETYAPKYMGVCDVVLAGDKIALVAPHIQADAMMDWVDVVDCSQKILFPGFIDNHVHLIGGGGEGGYETRTPEIQLSQFIEAGVTTAVGCLGTDGVSRQMESLIAKAKALRHEGISAFAYTGSYHIPFRTITDSIQKDLMMIEEVIGIGELALSDHRSSAPTFDAFMQAAAQARVGGLLSGKAGIINVHMGDGKQMLEYLKRAADESDIPRAQFLPTHMNRNEALFKEGIAYAKSGGFIDFTTSTVPQFLEAGEVKASLGFMRCLEAGVPLHHMTFSSDAQGSLPRFDARGVLEGLDIGKSLSLFEAVKELVVTHKLSWELAISPITAAPAEILKLKHKGHIGPGYDADCVLVRKDDLSICDVIAKGEYLMKDYALLRKGAFE